MTSRQHDFAAAIGEEQITHIYDGLAPSYDDRYRGAMGAYLHALEFAWLEAACTFRGRAVLDIGCGTARFLEFLRQQPTLYLGADLSFEMLRIGRAKHLPKASFVRMNGRQLAVRSSSFDVAVCLGALEYVTDLRPYIDEAFRVLKPGGSFVFTFRNYSPARARAIRLLGKVRRLFWDSRRPQSVSTGSAPHRVSDVRRLLVSRGLIVIDWASVCHVPPWWRDDVNHMIPEPAATRLLVQANLFLRKLSSRTGLFVIVHAAKPNRAPD